MKRLSATIHFSVLLVLLLLTARAPQCVAQQPRAAESAVSTAATDSAKRQEAFQIVWQTVNELFYDPKFGGVDWAGVRARYEPQVANLHSDRELHLLLQQMLNELHQSHFMVIPREAIPKLRLTGEAKDAGGDDEGDDHAETEEPFDNLRYKLTDRLLTGIGIDLRVLDGSAVLTRVEPGSAAARAGLRPGFVIKRVGDRSMDVIISEIEKHPLWGAIIRPELPVFLIAGFINGDETSSISLGYLDARNHLRTVRIKRERLKGEMSPAIGNLPSMYTEFEAKRLPGGIGYVRFSAFVPSLMEKLCGALRNMKDAPGIVLDLRGNQGGLLGMIGGLTGLLETTPTLMGTMQTRTGRIPLYVFPQNAPYSGPLVILVDGSTQSAAEMFASGLQEVGRAIVVGERSAGNTLPSAIKKLPTGAIFQYGFANFETTTGRQLEGQGVLPDLTVGLSRRGLLRGGDPQLTAGVARLRQEIGWRQKQDKELIAKLPADPEIIRPKAVPPVRVAIGSARPVTRITVEDPPPPEAKRSPPKPTVPGLPSAHDVLERYVAAIGGKSALEKIKSRVSTGTVELSALDVHGTIELSEESPNKSSMIIDAPGLGVMQRTFDGTRGWLQDPLQGLIRFSGLGLEVMKDAAIFNKAAKLDTLYPDPVLIGKEKLNDKDVYAVRMGFEKWYFGVDSGLLVRRGNTYYDDYREVDGVSLPFTVREEVLPGANMIYKLTAVKHNVKIDDAKFAPYPSCLANR